MSEAFRPPPPELIELIQEESERRLPPDQFHAYIAAALDPASREENQSLIDWFMRRYPTPAERLAYARRVAWQWRNPPFKSRPSKLVDVKEVLGQLPDLSTLKAVARDGVFQGQTFELRANGDWSTRSPGNFDHFSFDENITLDCPLGTIVLREATITHSDFTGAMSGICLEFTLTRRAASAGEGVIHRAFLLVDDRYSHRLWYPSVIEDPGSSTRRALLRIESGEGRLDCFYLKEGPFLVIDSMGATRDREAFRLAAYNVCLLLTYLCAGPELRLACMMSCSSRTGEALEINWYPTPEPSPGGSIHAPIPADFWSWHQAKEALSLEDADDFGPFRPESIGRWFDSLRAHPELRNALRLLNLGRSAEVEIAGALHAVALECVVKFVEKKRAADLTALKAMLPGLPEEFWNPLREALSTAAAPFLARLEPAERSRIIGRIGNLKEAARVTNWDRLTAAFEVLGVPLRDAEREAIQKRDQLLHEGRLIPLPLQADRGANREAFELEMRLYTATNKLLLKCLGYEGPIWDWGENPFGERPHVFVMI